LEFGLWILENVRIVDGDEQFDSGLSRARGALLDRFARRAVLRTLRSTLCLRSDLTALRQDKEELIGML
jgi:hypothetical protein